MADYVCLTRSCSSGRHTKCLTVQAGWEAQPERQQAPCKQLQRVTWMQWTWTLRPLCLLQVLHREMHSRSKTNTLSSTQPTAQACGRGSLRGNRLPASSCIGRLGRGTCGRCVCCACCKCCTVKCTAAPDQTHCTQHSPLHRRVGGAASKCTPVDLLAGCLGPRLHCKSSCINCSAAH